MIADMSATAHTDQVFLLSDFEKMDSKRVLLAIEKFCTEKNCFHKKKPAKRVADFYSKTLEVLHAELKKDQPVEENVFTVLSNILLLLNNASINNLEKFSVIQYDASTAINYLENSSHVDEKYKNIQDAEQREQAHTEAVSTIKRKRVKQILKRVFAGLIFVLFIIFLSGLFLPKASVPVEESKPFYTEAYDWIRFNIFGDKKPETPISISDRFRPYTYIAEITLVVICLLYLLMWGGCKIYQTRKKLYRIKVKQDWKEYQRLKEAFKIAERQLSKMEE